MTPTLTGILDELADTLDLYDYTITAAPRGESYQAGSADIVITHTPTGETVTLPELTVETLRETMQ